MKLSHIKYSCLALATIFLFASFWMIFLTLTEGPGYVGENFFPIFLFWAYSGLSVYAFFIVKRAFG